MDGPLNWPMFSSWLETMTPQVFMERHFQKQPHAEPGSARNAVSLLTWDKQAALIASSSRPDMIISRDGVFLEGSEPKSISEAQDLFASGCSIVLRNVEHFDEELRELARSFARELDGDVTVHAFATPIRSQGFGWHYDAEDVFIVQTAGSKQYYLRQNTVNPEPKFDAMPKDMQFEKETTPVIECSLIRDDWLYIPRGWWHMARALDDSLSLSIGVRN